MNEIYAEIALTLAGNMNLWRMPVVFLLIGFVIAMGMYAFKD